jgi:hypothetical protein
MSNRFGVVYPKQRTTLDGGMNSKFPRANILDNESPDCLNVVFSDGAVETRGGSVVLNTTAVGSFVIDGLYTRHDSDGSETMVVFAGGSSWYLSGPSTFSTIASAQSVFTAGVRVGAAEYQDYLFVGNGNVIPAKYDGTNWTRHGVPAPNSGPTAISGTTAVGTLTGAYQYKISYVNSALVEGDVGAATSTLTVASAYPYLTSIPVAPQSFGVAARRIYRTEASGTTFKRVAEIANNTTTVYSDTTADAGLGATAPSDKGEPPNYSVICYHADRMFCNDAANLSFLWYSDIAEPMTFPSTNFLRVGDATGDVIRALSVYNNSVLVLCDNSIWLVYMPSADDTTWNVIRIKGQYGSKSPWAPVFYNNKVLFPAVQNDKFVGFAAVSGDSVAPSATLLTAGTAGSDMVSNRIEPQMRDIIEAYISNISSIVYKQKAWISVTYGTGATSNNRIYILDFSTSNLAKAQGETWVPFTGMNASQFTIYNGRLYFGSSTPNGKVYQADTDSYNDSGAAINSYCWTKEFYGYGDHAGLFKDFREARMLIDNAGQWYMALNYRVDSDKDEAGYSIQFDLNPGGSLWGTAILGTSTWGGGTDQRDLKQTLGGARGTRLQFRFSNQNIADQYFKVHNLEFTYNIRGER